MTRGRLKVFLGAAPGVGKTYAMLEEGRRLRDEGRDVVVAIVETHGRAATEAMADGLEVLPRRTVDHRGVHLTDFDLPAVLARAPEVALVDELAHTNAPGTNHEKRWQDVESLLDAGIDVMSTINVQHIESLNDVVERITGVPHRETIPDEVLRRADQVEVVDLAPEALRRRLAEGCIYPSGRINAALSNYFRVGNLTALRELALLWLADEVDSALQRYRAEQGIDDKWEARERVVVALTGGPEGRTLLRRGARIASRSAGGLLLAVHVTNQDGLRDADPAELAAQRELVLKLGGTYHEVVGDQTSKALVEFAKGANASQLVIGVSRRSRLTALLTGPGIGATVIRESGEIDVHIVNHASAGRGFALPHGGGALSWRRRLLGAVVALLGGPLLTLLLTVFQSEESITGDVLSYQLLVIVVALIGGIWPALFAAVLSGLTLDFFFIEPVRTLTIGEPAHFTALVLYIVNAVLVSYVVDQAARRTRAASRAAAESELLATVAGGVLHGQDTLQALVTQTREAFGLDAVRLRGTDGTLLNEDDSLPPLPAQSNPATVPVGGRAVLELVGQPLEAADRRLLGVITTQMDTALEYRDLSRAASEVGPLAAADRVRTALLAAVGHDLRRPLTSATTAVTSLRSSAITFSPDEQGALLDTAAQSLRTLSNLVTDLLDASRIQAGVLGVVVEPVRPEDVILPALEELDLGPGDVALDLPAESQLLRADAVLLQRVLVNLLSNASRYASGRETPVLSVSDFGGRTELRIIDHGPGIADDRKDQVFMPFQRLGDTDNDTGLGLGMALAKGFVEGMGGLLTLEDTPGGGLTSVISLPHALQSDPVLLTGDSVGAA
ncbi:sensor histidine kinase [Arthrobacter sp. MN05-02]|nr:sensor histidine kinase [Arthrobacter sp. MN05-02]